MRNRPLMLIISFFPIEEVKMLAISYFYIVFSFQGCKDIFFLASFIIIRYFCLLKFPY